MQHHYESHICIQKYAQYANFWRYANCAYYALTCFVYKDCACKYIDSSPAALCSTTISRLMAQAFVKQTSCSSTADNVGAVDEVMCSLCVPSVCIYSWHDLFTLSHSFRKHKAGALAKDEAKMLKKANGRSFQASCNQCNVSRVFMTYSLRYLLQILCLPQSGNVWLVV